MYIMNRLVTYDLGAHLPINMTKRIAIFSILVYTVTPFIFFIFFCSSMVKYKKRNLNSTKPNQTKSKFNQTKPTNKKPFSTTPNQNKLTKANLNKLNQNQAKQTKSKLKPTKPYQNQPNQIKTNQTNNPWAGIEKKNQSEFNQAF